MFKRVDLFALKCNAMKSIFVGFDVSKETLDACVLLGGQLHSEKKLANEPKVLKQWLAQLVKELCVSKSEWLLCMEHTGIYCAHVIEVTAYLGLDLWIEDASRIKAFHSLSRGKNDQLDAQRIAKYAYIKQEYAKLWQAPRPEIRKLKALNQLRKRLLNTRQRLAVPMGEDEYMKIGAWAKEHQKHIKNILKEVDLQIREIENEMNQIIASDEHLNALYSHISSVRGVGLIVGVSILVITNEFKWINDPRKMACQCGVAPFPYESGKSIRGRTKVSHRAHKPMKVLLNLAARSAVSSPGELRDYYQRKVEEGKNKMVVLNAIRNKIIHRVFACVRDQRKYDKNYIHTLA